MSNKRRRFDRKRKVRLKRMLAERDGLAPEGSFDREGEPFVRCAECDGPVPFPEITIGHVVPLGEGGSNDPSNLRLECPTCNQDDNNHRLLMKAVIGSRGTRQTPGSLRRIAEMTEFRKKRRRGKVYDSVRVLDAQGRHASFTSVKQAAGLLGAGIVRVAQAEPGGIPRVIQMIRDIPVVNPDQVERPNSCLVCDAERYLTLFSYWPRWHPDWRGARRTHRTVSLCRICAVRAQQWQGRILEEHGLGSARVRRSEADRRAKAALVEARGRLGKGLELRPELKIRLRAQAGIDLDDELARLGRDGTLEVLSSRISALKERQQEEDKALRRGCRDRVVGTRVDFHELFWTFVSERRRALAGYLRSDDSVIRNLEAQMRRVREELRQARPS